METHIWQIIVVSVLLAISATAKAIQDKLQFHFEDSVFSKLGNWWNAKHSWKNKWKNGDKKQGEAFFLSSTLLVGLTDAWHLFGTIRDLSMFLCIVVVSLNPFILLLYIFYRLMFHLLFTYVLSKKK
jgi:hypothetical protein